MAHKNKNKGDRAEREVAKLLTQLLRRPVRRKLGAGRQDDTGDLDGIQDWTVQVKNRRDIARAIREGINQLDEQQRNNNTPHATLLIRTPGGVWLSVQRIEQWAKTLGETQNEQRDP